MAFWMGTIKGRGNLSYVNFLCFYCTSEVSGPLQLGDASTKAEGKNLRIMEDSTPVLLTENIIHVHQSASRKSFNVVSFELKVC